MTEHTTSKLMQAVNDGLGMRHTRALPRSSRWERLYFRIVGHNPQSVVNRRMEAIALDEQERDAWLRDNAP